MNRNEYQLKCEQRWHGPALRDALNNWEHFQEIHAGLAEVLEKFRTNPFQEDLAGQCHNPEGTLYGLLWHVQAAWQPDRSRLDPLLDFEEHYQRVFLRRGLVIYCELLLDELKPKRPVAHPELVLV